MKNSITKKLVVVGMIIYILSPIDLIPGCPIDDLIVGLFGLIYEYKQKVAIE